MKKEHFVEDHNESLPYRGLYQHYKGNLYMVLMIATDVGNNQTLIIYQDVVTQRVWARSFYEWRKPVRTDDESQKTIPRFKRYIG